MIKKALPQLDLLSFHAFPHYTPPEETGHSFEENAIMKAEHAAQTLGCWTLADDSGLVVPALGGAPGVHTARYAGQKASDKENRQKLLDEMRSLHDLDRQAYFECCLALASPEGCKKCVRATCEGHISSAERGNHGFGYDPLFFKHEYSKSFAELDEETKNMVSHRRKALDRLLPLLEGLCSTT
jgi:XTP/dITP diphosphohydrolase